MSCYVQSRIEGARGGEMIEMRRAQLRFGDGLIAEDVSELRKEWMQHADQMLADEQIVAAVHEALAKRCPNSRSRGRLGTIATDQVKLRRVPRLVATDAGFYSARNEAAARAMGVKRVCIPNRSSKSPERKRQQKKRWFRDGQKWRTRCEGRISVVTRRNGLNRC